jgi:hypothetical protein
MSDADSPGRLAPGLAAVALFVVMAAAFRGADFAAATGGATGFATGESVVASIGFALLNLDLGGIPAEGFLAGFLIIALTLDVAIDAALFLAKREEDGSVVAAVGEAFGDDARDRRDVRGDD